MNFDVPQKIEPINQPETEPSYKNLRDFLVERKKVEKALGKAFREQIDREYIKKEPLDQEKDAQLKAEYKAAEERRNELDREILAMKISLGLESLDRVLSDKENVWNKTTGDRNSSLGLEEWKLATKDEILFARLMVQKKLYFKETFLSEGDRRAALVARENDARPYEDMVLEFRIKPRKGRLIYVLSGLNMEGSFGVEKRFGSKKDWDEVNVGFGTTFNFHSAPQIPDEVKEKAVDLATRFAQKVGIKGFI